MNINIKIIIKNKNVLHPLTDYTSDNNFKVSDRKHYKHL